MTETLSVFLKVDPKFRVVENQLAFALYDIKPVSEGHILIIPKRQFESFFDCTPEEIAAIYDLLHQAKKILIDKFRPDGFNVGINIGESAGQIVMHVHVHLIPRYKGKKIDKNQHAPILGHL